MVPAHAAGATWVAHSRRKQAAARTRPLRIWRQGEKRLGGSTHGPAAAPPPRPARRRACLVRRRRRVRRAERDQSAHSGVRLAVRAAQRVCRGAQRLVLVLCLPQEGPRQPAAGCAGGRGAAGRTGGLVSSLRGTNSAGAESAPGAPWSACRPGSSHGRRCHVAPLHPVPGDGLGQRLRARQAAMGQVPAGPAPTHPSAPAGQPARCQSPTVRGPQPPSLAPGTCSRGRQRRGQVHLYIHLGLGFQAARLGSRRRGRVQGTHAAARARSILVLGPRSRGRVQAAG